MCIFVMLVVAKLPVFACRGRHRLPCLIHLQRLSPRTMRHGLPGRMAGAFAICQVILPQRLPSCISPLGDKGDSSTMAGAVLVVNFAVYHASVDS